MSRLTSLSDWLLRQPLLWGGLVCLGFYALIQQGIIDDPRIIRYAAAHPVEYVTIGLFLIGTASLVMRLLGIAGQYAVFQHQLLEPIPPGGQPIVACSHLLSGLSLLPQVLQHSYLVARLREALQFIRKKDSADTLDGHLRHLEEADAIHMSGGYAMVRIIIWAIPILGFLGTVIGITMAIANLDADSLENSLPQVTSTLALAFDTTALALALSIVLMFLKFCVERMEDGLLAKVDARVTEELVGRFHQTGSAGDPNAIAVRRMSEQVLDAVETLTARQAQLWKSTIDQTHEQWADVTATAGQVLQNALSTALRQSCDQHAQALNEGARQHVDRLHQTAREHADQISLAAQQHTERISQGSERLSAALENGAQQHSDRIAKVTDELVLVLRQVTEAHAEKVSQGADKTVGQLRDGLEKLAELLVEALHQHGESLTRSERELAEENRRHLSEVEAALGEAMVVAADRQENLIHRSEDLLKEMQEALVEAAGATIDQQEQLVRQGDVLLKIVDATGQIRKLEESLNSNLTSLGRAHNFEETLLTLSAALQLLSARLSHPSPAARPFAIQADETTSHAA